MKRGAIILILILVLVIVVGIRLSWRPSGSDSRDAADSTSSVASTSNLVRLSETATLTASPPGQAPPLAGELILRDYGRSNLPPENDLTLMSHLMENSLLLLKSAANRPLSANEDWADLLRGSNAVHERFLPDSHVALNARGQLVDRWGTPLFIHALGGQRFEIRSAGPDRRLWTDDDLHRNADGSFRRGSELNPPALFAPDADPAPQHP